MFETALQPGHRFILPRLPVKPEIKYCHLFNLPIFFIYLFTFLFFILSKLFFVGYVQAFCLPARSNQIF